MKKTTKYHFEYFKKQCEFWIGVLGLVDWRISFEHVGKDGEYATCWTDSPGRVAVIEFTKTWDETQKGLNENEIDLLALHETLHVANSPLLRCSNMRFIHQDSIAMEEEALARRLTNVIWKFYKEDE